MDKQYTEEELKNIEKSKQLSKLIGPAMGFVIGTVGIGIFTGSAIIGLIAGVIVAGVIFVLIRKNG